MDYHCVFFSTYDRLSQINSMLICISIPTFVVLLLHTHIKSVWVRLWVSNPQQPLCQTLVPRPASRALLWLLITLTSFVSQTLSRRDERALIHFWPHCCPPHPDLVITLTSPTKNQMFVFFCITQLFLSVTQSRGWLDLSATKKMQFSQDLLQKFVLKYK